MDAVNKSSRQAAKTKKQMPNSIAQTSTPLSSSDQKVANQTSRRKVISWPRWLKRALPKALIKSNDIKAKKIKEGLIDDPIAREIFQGLGVSQTFFHSGKVLAWALSPEDEQFIDIHDYVERSQHHDFGIKILTILRIISKADDFEDFNDDPFYKEQQRMMLWHGTSSDRVASILENGLLIPKSTRQMFGTGIYFADRVSKSAQYCIGRSGTKIPAGSIGYLFACDVLLGNISDAYAHNYDLTAAPYGYESVRGLGNNIPDPKWSKKANGGCLWPLGPTVKPKSSTYTYPLKYNEYIVYDTNQVQPKYLVKVEFTEKPNYEKLTPIYPNRYMRLVR